MSLYKGTTVGEYVGYLFFCSYLIVQFVVIKNLITAQLIAVYYVVRQGQKTLYLLSTLSVREVTEADDKGKYSAVISAPFPMTALNIGLGSITLAAKSPGMNNFALNFYYFPIMLILTIVFLAYQLLILPLAFLKIAGHKWALMVRAPRGKGSSSSSDRAGQALLFMIVGPLIMVLNVIVDTYWFIRHLYKTDLDKSVTKKIKSEVSMELPEIHRRTYKRMLIYFEVQNEQLVLEKSVALDLRKFLDVDEGLRCMIFGKPKDIHKSKIDFYMAYAKSNNKTGEQEEGEQGDGEKKVAEAKEDENLDDDLFFMIERVVQEYSTIKTVLLNNSFPVNIEDLQRGTNQSLTTMNSKGYGTRLLFDKKVFLFMLNELESMRKLLTVKKQFYIFHLPYFGKPQAMSAWHKKVEARTTQTLKFVNYSRILRIIGYDPGKYMNN